MELGLVHIAEVETGEIGMPLVPSVFGLAARYGRHHIQCYVSADILFVNDLIETIDRILFERFLPVGQRWDFHVTELINFDNRTWRTELLARKRHEGVLHPPAGSDYFVARWVHLGQFRR